MISSRPVFHLLKVTLEAQSAHAIHTGHGDTTHDSLVVRDANGLPTLSGTSLAGVLRHEYQRKYGEQACQQVFGYAKGEEGQSSWLNVGWGLVHNSQDIAKEGLLTDEELSDPLLNLLKDDKPIVRQRVRLNDKGSSVETGKFDVTLIPAGVRYSFWISYWGENSEAGKAKSETQWHNILKLFTEQSIRVGHGTSNGYGLFKAVRLHKAQWDLTTTEGQQAYCNRGRTRMDYRDMTQIEGFDGIKQNSATLSAVLDLTAESAWRIGGGERYIESVHDFNKDDEIEPNILPMHEAKVIWTGDKAEQTGTMGEQHYLLPASAIKGAIRHRVAYHYNCLAGLFAEDDTAPDTDENPAVKALFGYTEDKQSEAGVLAFHDVYLTEQSTQTLMHNKVDRFTGGVINGALFSEHVLWQSNINIQLDITKPNKINDPMIKQALVRSLNDLSNGWLPLGSSSSRGLGVFLAMKNQDIQGVQWSDNQAWLAQETA